MATFLSAGLVRSTLIITYAPGCTPFSKREAGRAIRCVLGGPCNACMVGEVQTKIDMGTDNGGKDQFAREVPRYTATVPQKDMT